MKLLVSNPRYGSTHVSKYFDNYNRSKMKCYEFEGFNEFLLNASHAPSMPIEEKINFIEKKRLEGLEVLYKIHSAHLFYPYKNGIVYDWFKEFYKDADIYVLKRRDIWRAFLSLLVHHQKGRTLWHKHKEEDENKLINICKKTNFYHDPRVMESFFYSIKCLDRIKGKIIYLEDINLNSKSLPWKLNYEEYFEASELSIIREKFRSFSERIY